MTNPSSPLHQNAYLPTLSRMVKELDGHYPGCSILDIVLDHVHWDNAEINVSDEFPHDYWANIAAQGWSIEANVKMKLERSNMKKNALLPLGIELELIIQDSHNSKLRFVSRMWRKGWQFRHAKFELYRMNGEASFPLAGYPHVLHSNGWLDDARQAVEFGGLDHPFPTEAAMRGQSQDAGAIAAALFYIAVAFDWENERFSRPVNFDVFCAKLEDMMRMTKAA